MPEPEPLRQISELVARIEALPFAGLRRLIALVGAPASGKSTLADQICERIDASKVIPMDGYHLDNTVLDASGLRDRKGSPQTFDVASFVQLIDDLAVTPVISYPLFDRKTDRAIANAGQVDAQTTTVIVEGNYLLLDAERWRSLHHKWDLSIALVVPMQILEARLIKRWTGLGLTHDEAMAKTHNNDLPNAVTVAENSFSADIRFET